MPMLHGNPYGPRRHRRRADCQAGQTGYALGDALMPGQGRTTRLRGAERRPGGGRFRLGRTDLSAGRTAAGSADPRPARCERATKQRLPNGRRADRDRSDPFGFYLALTKRVPFTGGLRGQGGRSNAQNIRANSPVRIAGVNVGEVTDVKHVVAANGTARGRRGDDESRTTAPDPQDATLQLRPRLFLEGNLFVDVTRAAPSSPEVHSGEVPRDPDGELGPARPGADPPSRRTCAEPAGPAQGVRRRLRPSTAAPRASRSPTGPRPRPSRTRPRSTRRCSARAGRPAGVVRTSTSSPSPSTRTGASSRA